MCLFENTSKDSGFFNKNWFSWYDLSSLEICSMGHETFCIYYSNNNDIRSTVLLERKLKVTARHYVLSLSLQRQYGAVKYGRRWMRRRATLHGGQGSENVRCIAQNIGALASWHPLRGESLLSAFSLRYVAQLHGIYTITIIVNTIVISIVVIRIIWSTNRAVFYDQGRNLTRWQCVSLNDNGKSFDCKDRERELRVRSGLSGSDYARDRSRAFPRSAGNVIPEVGQAGLTCVGVQAYRVRACVRASTYKP